MTPYGLFDLLNNFAKSFDLMKNVNFDLMKFDFLIIVLFSSYINTIFLIRTNSMHSKSRTTVSTKRS
jgi:hypothetical protein